MQDRFKYRFWDKTKKIMIADYVTDEQWKYICSQYTEHEWYWNVELGLTTVLDYFDDKNTVIMQCTGLKDKNGKLIYENDVVKLTGEGVDNTHIVKFGDFAMYSLDFQTAYEIGSTAVYGWYLGGLKYPVPLSISLDTSGLVIEVIGNIYQDSQLLEEQK